jgi:UDPglucose 6-dehydrogenase
MRVTVTGLGYLGLVHAVTLAEMGNEVLGLDIDEEKIKWVKRGLVPFSEPELEEMLNRHLGSGKLQFTTNATEVAKYANAHFLCVGTPLTPVGLPDLHYLFDAVESLALHFKGPENLIIGKSTAPPGTAAQLLQVARRDVHQDGYVDIAWNPEFLREGTAVQDSLQPSRLVFGVNNKRAEMTLREIYGQISQSHVQPFVTDVETAELSKLASNAFLATKISFINGVAQFCEANGGNIQDITRIMGYDPRIGMLGMQPGLGYGGGCLPKDVSMFTRLADDNGARRLGRFLHSVTRINASRVQQVIDLANSILNGVEGQNIAILGAAFKPGTSDTRESPGLEIASVLKAQGAYVVFHDPHVNKHDPYQFMDLTADAITNRDLVIIATNHPEYGKIDPSRFDPSKIIDGRYILDRKKWETAGWEYHEVGK